MKPYIQHTSFGAITVDKHDYDHDIIIRSNGVVEKRRKKLSKQVYGTSHKLSLDEAEHIYEEGISKIIIGCGQYGQLDLSPEAKAFFKKKQVSVILVDTPAAIQKYNDAEEPCVGVFHITC